MLDVTVGWGAPIEPLIWREPGPRCSGFEVEETLDLLRRQSGGGALFALLDAARDEEVLRVLCLGEVEYRSLYRGTPHETAFAGSPILVPYLPGTRLAEWLTGEVFGKRVALYLATRASLEELAAHLSRYAIVDAQRGGSVFLRLADPFVLHAFLGACTFEERLAFMGPVSLLAMEAGNDGLLCFTRYDLIQGDAEKLAAAEKVAPVSRFVLGERHELAFAAMTSECFRRRACSELRARCEAELAGMCDDDLLELVAIACKRARRRGLARDRDLLGYLELAVKHGVDFDAPQVSPEVDAALSDEELQPEQRLTRAAELLGQAAAGAPEP